MTDEQLPPVEPQQAAENPKPQPQPGDSPKPAEPVEGDLAPPKAEMPS